jgi:PAS domain S-box-containing protein
MAYCLLAESQSTVETRIKGPAARRVSWEIKCIEKGGNSSDRFLLVGAPHEVENRHSPKLLESMRKLNENIQFERHHYETIMERLGVGIILQDGRGVITAANLRTAELFNVSLEDMYQDNAFEQLWKTTGRNGNPVPFENSPPMKALRTGETQVSEILTIAGHGNDKRQVVINSLPVFDKDPLLPSFVISSILDKSEERKLQALCEERQALFESFMDHSPSFAWIVDEEEKVIYANKGLLDYFGADERVLGRNIYDILPKFVADAGHNKHAWVLENNLPHTSILKSPPINGEERVFHVTTFPANGDGSMKMIGGQAWEITESYQAKFQLKKTNERLLYLNRAASEAIWDWNMHTGQIFRNLALLKMIGYHREKPNGLSWWYNQIHPEDRQKVQDKIEHILAEKEKAWEQEYRFLCADGSYKIVFDRGFVIYQGNMPTRMVGSLQDVTEIKQLEAKLVSEKLKKQQQIAEAILQAQEQERTRIGQELHDNVNQILFSCKLYMDMIKPVAEEEIELKEKTQELILMAIEEIRILSKDLVSPPLTEMGLIPCINNLVAEVSLADLFTINFAVENESEIEAINYNIKVTLFRIIQEQIKNIIKYSQAHHVSVWLSVADKKVDLSIEDDGIGFDVLQTRRGIGLSNIYERSKLYHGRVDLNTQPGKGCVLKIAIPLV